jgi:hypothetical protein
MGILKKAVIHVFVLIAVGFLMLYGYAGAADWKLMDKDEAGDKYYYDAENINFASPDMVEVSTKIEYQSKPGLKESQDLIIIDCKNKTYYIKETTEFYTDGTKDKSTAEPAWDPINPESMLEALSNIACTSK